MKTLTRVVAVLTLVVGMIAQQSYGQGAAEVEEAPEAVEEALRLSLAAEAQVEAFQQRFQLGPQPEVDITIDGIGVAADEIHFDTNAGVLEAVGNVRLTPGTSADLRRAGLFRPLGVASFGGSTINADRATVDRNMRTIHAVGNVRLIMSGDGSIVLEAPEATIRYGEPAETLVEAQP
jgi:lipopolysaccharide assembly outer membrane protein LptD (OstA)